MKRLNPVTGTIFRQGDVCPDTGKIFWAYNRGRTGIRSGYYDEQWYSSRETFDRARARSAKNNRKKQKERRQWLNSIKLERGCDCCAYKDCASALDFDHVDASSKRGRGVGWMVSHSKEIQLKEMEKCILLCANCHRMKTHEPEEFKRYWDMHHSPQEVDYI